MKNISIIFFSLSLILSLCGCESMGCNPNAVDEALTPNVDATTTVRTWQQAPDGTMVPVYKEVANPQAFE